MILLFILHGLRAQNTIKEITFDSMCLYLGAFQMMLLIVYTFVCCANQILLYYFSIQTGTILFIFYKFFRALLYKSKLKAAAKKYLRPYVVLIYAAIILLDIFAVIPSTSNDLNIGL
mmetsp:Transcript_31605/g.23438  ORF Transcript_31605/g.23438 Transcript_31605/m.23438 type:complete len:117 (-) Transcript_31605:734-1084(-)